MAGQMFLRVEEVAKELDISIPYAYKLIRSMIKASLWQKFSVSQSEPASGIRAFQTLPDGANKFLVAREVLTARQQLATLSFVDDEFAEAAGFLIRDDLSKLNLPDGAKITYRVEAPGGWKTSVSVTCGAENNLSKPQGLMGYGVDGKVPLRWDQTESGDERKIISGYLIERKLDGESGFTQISKEPVAVSYMLNIGYEALVPVSLLQAAVEQKGNQYVMTAGTVYLEEPFELQSIGVTLVSLEISPLKNKAAVGGHAERERISFLPANHGALSIYPLSAVQPLYIC